MVSVPDDPADRLHLRREFYEKYGFGANGGYGSSELEFLEWEVARGVLNPLTAAKPGSTWWRSVNAQLITDSASAAVLFEEKDLRPAEGPIGCWLTYMRQPSARTWYRAHNASVVTGYILYADLAREETRAEQIFVNIVLYRVLYAQAMVEGEATGLLGEIERVVSVVKRVEEMASDPRSRSVDLMVHMPEFYPREYPVSRQHITQILGLERLHDFSVNVLFDKALSADMSGLYALASGWLNLPDLCQFVVGDTPIYPSQRFPGQT